MLALLDMDICVFRSAASSENESEAIAIHRLEELVDQILLKTQADSYKAYLSSPTNFRKQIYAEYKAQRTQPKPKHLQLLREYSIEKLGAEIATDGLEADDMLAIEQDKKGFKVAHAGDDPFHTSIICSLDKDLLQISGEHFQWAIEGGTPDKRWSKPDMFITQSEIGGLKLLYEQVLKGDSSDNVKGVKGIGKVRAKELISPCETEKEMIEVCLEQYGNEEEMIMNASCLYLLRHIGDSYINRFEGIMNET